MVTNSNLRDNQIKKRIKRNRSKKKQKKAKCERQDQSNRQPELVLENQTSATNKLQKLIQEVVQHTTREKIVLLFIEAAQKAENCFDFQIGYWLDKYNEFADEINFTEAALLIINAAHIYGRKVDFFHRFVSSSIQDSRNVTGETNGESSQSAPKPRGQAVRRPLSLRDGLYEAQMVTKQFKTTSNARTTEILSTLISTEAPKAYFRKWNDYKAWRLNHKKKMKSPVPYSIVCDDTYLHSAMWRLSCIEDFDYDDDVDTKRSYRMFTHYTEHRYATLVPDVNFIMHFKVKDFIEAEEDEIEIMKILGLPVPPTRQWSPFCKTPCSNVDVNENSYDYIAQYVAVEDIVLEKEVYEIDSVLFQSAAEASKKGLNNGGITNTAIEATSTPVGLELEELPTITVIEIVDADKEVNAAPAGIESVPETETTSIPTIAVIDTSNISVPLPTAETVLVPVSDENNLNVANLPPVENAMNAKKPEQIDLTTNPSPVGESIVVQESDKLIISKNASEIISENIRNNIADQIFVRLSIDEGVSFGDLDDLDRAMLSPVVELVDFLQQIKEEINEPVNFTVDKRIKNLFAIDEAYLNFEESFRLPFEVVYKAPPLELNILKLPESKIRRKLLFSMPADYSLYKSCRLKRKRVEKEVTRKIKVFKMNCVDISDVPITPPATPRPEHDFLGFDESELQYDSFASNDILSSTLTETLLNLSQTKAAVVSPNRISNDSGIGLTTLSDSQVSAVDTSVQGDLTTSVENVVNTIEPTPEAVPKIKKVSCVDSQNAIELLTKRISDSNGKLSLDENSRRVSASNIIEKKVEEMSQMMDRIQKWHRHLKPILANSKDRHHFDIFAIGTEIMDTFPEEDVESNNLNISLENIMSIKDPSFLSRYFLSMLQLANSNNLQIQINNRTPEVPVPLSDIHLKLLSRQRHSIAIEDDIGAHTPSSRKRRRSETSDEYSPARKIIQLQSKNKDSSISAYNQQQGRNDTMCNVGASTSKGISSLQNTHRLSSSRSLLIVNQGASTSKAHSSSNYKQYVSGNKVTLNYSERTSTCIANSNLSYNQRASTSKADSNLLYNQGASTSKSSSSLDYNQGASTSKVDSNLDYNRGASTSKADLSSNYNQGPSTSKSYSNLDYNQGASTSKADSNVVYNQGASTSKSSSNLAYNQGASTSKVDSYLDYNRGASTSKADFSSNYNQGASTSKSSSNLDYNQLASTSKADSNLVYNQGASTSKSPSSLAYNQRASTSKVDSYLDYNRGASTSKADLSSNYNQGASTSTGRNQVGCSSISITKSTPTNRAYSQLSTESVLRNSVLTLPKTAVSTSISKNIATQPEIVPLNSNSSVISNPGPSPSKIVGSDENDKETYLQEFISKHSKDIPSSLVNVYHERFNEAAKILRKYQESNRKMLSNEVNAHRNDYIRTLSQKHDINLSLYLTPEEIEKVLRSTQQGNNSFARDCLIYPKQIRTHSIFNTKRISSNNDDLDSGVFSSSELNSLIL